MRHLIVGSILVFLSVPGANAASKNANNVPSNGGPVERAETVGTEITQLTDESPKLLQRTDATYIAPHFARVKLGPGDSLTVRSDDGSRSWTYTSDSVPKSADGFWSLAIPRKADQRKATAVIDLKNVSGTASYKIDKFVAGLTPANVVSRNAAPGFLEVCGDDDSEEAACRAGQPMHDKSKAVARLLIRGQKACTGWLVGSEGHLITNFHCIKTDADAANVQIEFMAEGPSCSTNCNSWFACPGKVVALSAPRVAKSKANDYAVLKLDKSVATAFGFFKIRRAGPQKDEPVYIPQHPRGAGKRIVAKSSDPADASGPTPGAAHINTLTVSACSGFGPKEVGYKADTDPGASGSPVTSATDHLVVALHHCGGCPNHAIPMDRLVPELSLVLPPDAFQ